MPFLELMIIIGIIIGLVVLNKINSYFPRSVKDKSTNIKLGLSALLFFNMSNIILPIDNINSASFLSDSFFINLIYLTGSLFGGFLMIHGISEWIPSINKFSKNEQRQIKRLELFNNAELYNGKQYIFTGFAEKLFDDILALYNLDNIALIGYCHKIGSFQTHVIKGRDVIDFDTSEITFDTTLYDIYKECHLKFNNISRQPDLIFPFIISEKPVAFICLWNNQDNTFTDKEINEIKTLSKLIESKLANDVNKEFKKVINFNEISKNKIEGHIRGNTNEEKIQSIFDYTRKTIPLDYLSLVIKKVNDNFIKYSVSESRNILKEVYTDFYTMPGVSGYSYKNNIPVIIDNLGEETDFLVEPQIMKSDMRSMAVYPLADNVNTLGVITFACRDASVYRGETKLFIERCLSFFKEIIFDQQYHNDITEQLDRLNKLEKFALKVNESNDPQQILSSAIGLLAEEIHPSMIRFSEYSKDEPFLYSHSLRTVIPYDKMMPDDGIMIRSLMPVHQIVIEQKRTLHVSGKGNNQITESEAVQIFGRRVSSMVVVPVVHQGKLYGLISMAELRSDERYSFTLADIKLAESITRILSKGLSKIEKNESEEKEKAEYPSNELNSKIKNSMTGILNSVEILKTNNNDPRTVKACISILDNSAHDINDTLTKVTDYR